MYKERLREVRVNHNYTLQEMSHLFNFEKDTYGRYERENDTIPIKHLWTITNFFNVSFDYLFSFTEKISYNNLSSVIDTKLIGIRLKNFRKNSRLTQNKLAKFLNTNQSVIANYERGRTIISTPFLYAICKEYGVSADYLLGRIDEPMYFNEKKKMSE